MRPDACHGSSICHDRLLALGALGCWHESKRIGLVPTPARPPCVRPRPRPWACAACTARSWVEQYQLEMRSLEERADIVTCLAAFDDSTASIPRWEQGAS